MIFARARFTTLIHTLLITAALPLGGCAEDIFRPNSPLLALTPFESDDTRYSGTDIGMTGPNGETIEAFIDLGEVAVYSTRRALFLMDNDSSSDLLVSVVEPESSTGGDWLVPTWRTSSDDATKHRALPSSVGAFKSNILEIPFSPAAEGPADAIYKITSDANNGRYKYVWVKAVGVFDGTLEIQVEYNNVVAPEASDCVDSDGDGSINTCVVSTPLNMGGVGLGTQGSSRLFIRNASRCGIYPGAAPCESCVLRVDANPDAYDVGFGFKPGTNTDGLFSFQGSTSTPFELPQDETGCGNANFVRPVLQFNAPTTEGIHETIIIVESNDPARPVIEIPVRASAVNAPIAIARFRAFDPTNPAAPYTDEDDLEPLTRVYLDGRAKGTSTSSHDTSDPTDASLIRSYSWEVIDAPPGVDRAQFQPQGIGSGLWSFFIPLAGHYTVMLTVTNSAGLPSLDTEQARVDFDAVPSDKLHIQLVWDDASNDQDLHLTYANTSDLVCEKPNDCHWRNRTPVWFTGQAADQGPNPSLDVDDTNGLGPENINIEEPLPGTYRIYVHYFGDFSFSGMSPTRETIRVWINGIQAGEFKRTLTVEKSVWAVADVTWNVDGSGYVTPYPSDQAGEIGAVANMQSCSDEGWAFP